MTTRKERSFSEQLARLKSDTATVRYTMRAAVFQVLDPFTQDDLSDDRRKPDKTVESRAKDVAKVLDELAAEMKRCRKDLANNVLIDQLENHAVDRACTPEEALTWAQKVWDMWYLPYAYGQRVSKEGTLTFRSGRGMKYTSWTTPSRHDALTWVRERRATRYGTAGRG
jgi:hypothetical protein